MIKKFESYNSEFSQEDFKKMIYDCLYHLNESTPNLLKLIFLNGGKLDNDETFFSGIINNPSRTSNYKMELLKILIEYGGADINKKYYWNGNIGYVNSLLLLTSLFKNNKYFSYNHFYKMIIGLVEIGGDMTIKDSNGKSSYDYIDEKDVDYLDKYIKNFKKDYELYMKTKNYNL